MLKFTEKCFYIVLLIILLFLAFFVPIIVVQVGTTVPTYIYISPANRNADGTLLDPKSKKHLEEYIDNYYNLEELYEYLDDFVQYRRVLFSKNTQQQDSKNRIYEITMKKPSSCDTKKSKIVVVSGLEPRDWASVLTTIETMNLFFTDVKKSSKLLNSFEIHFLPLMNPDGYEHSMSLPVYQNSFDQNGGFELFKNYFKKNKDAIDAVFFLVSPRVTDYKKRYSIPNEFVSEDICKKKVIGTVEKFIAAYDDQLELITEETSGGVDQWVLNETRSKPILAVKFLANFIPGPPEYLRDRIKELGSDSYFIITTLLRAFKVMLC